ncbi:MAG: glycosyltransferase family 39 protein [Verrucomicrobia bacterium]|nr:glycosyltransferase family 39 protein [Verrucomicrobiota bacterium]
MPGARPSRRRALGAAILCSVVGIALALVATSRGVGVSPDSVSYISGVRNLLDGHGLCRFPNASGQCAPIVNWPPLYPLMLAAVSATGLETLVAARWLSAVLFGATIFLVGLMARRLAAPTWLVFVAALSVATANDMVAVHAMAWSEPPCIFFGLLGILLLDRHLDRPRRLTLMAAAASLACAFLTRYAAFAYLMVGACALGLLGRRRFPARLVDLGLFAGVVGVPLAAALVRNVVVGGSATGRVMASQPILIPVQLGDGLNTASLWVLPQFVSSPAVQALVLGMLVAGAVAWHFWLRRRAAAGSASTAESASSLPALLIALVVFHLALVIAYICFVFHGTPLNGRTLSPVFPAVVLLAVWMVARELRSPRQVRFVRIACVAACVLLVATYSVRAVRLAANLRYGGLCYGDDEWANADILRHVKALAVDRPIYSNSPDVVYFFTGRGASFTPRAEANEATLETMRAHLEATQGVVVYFEKGRQQGYMAPADLAGRLQLKLLVQAADGAIYESAGE